MLQQPTHPHPPRLQGMVLQPLPLHGVGLWGGVPRQTLFPWFTNFQAVWLGKATKGLIKLLIKSLSKVIKEGRQESLEPEPKDEVSPLSGPLTVPAGRPVLWVSSLPTLKGCSSAGPKSPGQKGTSLPQGHSPILRQPWLHCGFATWQNPFTGKDSQIQGTPSHFFYFLCENYNGY